MPRFRKRVTRRTLGKDARKMVKSQRFDITVGTPQITQIVEPTIYADSIGTGDVFENADTREICSPNSLVKYFNFRLSTLPKAAANPGILEYGLVVFEELQAAYTLDAAITAAMGTNTLQDILHNLYRGKVIWTGVIPCAAQVPNTQDIKIKMPEKYVKNMRGKEFILFLNVKTNNSTDSTSVFNVWYDHLYKNYI